MTSSPLPDPFSLQTDYAYVIAEIGNNHQGSLELAVKLVEEAANAGVDAVKFQKRSNKELYTDSFYSQPYINRNSFGATYGEHRENVELTIDDMSVLSKAANHKGIVFFATPFDFSSLEELESIDCPFYKLASADIVHIPLIERISSTGKPLIMSTGCSTWSDIDRAISVLPKSTRLALLHCTASYPASFSDMNLSCIPHFINSYGDRAAIGLSDHENGIDAASIAYMLGARVFEKHFTLDHAWKGTDNPFSLMPDGLRRLVRNLRRIPIMLGTPQKVPLESESVPVHKMRKSIVYSDNFKAGDILTEDMIEYRCPGGGLEPFYAPTILSKRLHVDVSRHQYVQHDHLAPNA